MRVLVNPTPIVSAAPVGAVFESSFGVVVSLHANAPAATATTATRTRRGLAAEFKTSANWDNETRCGEMDIMAPEAGYGLAFLHLLKRNRRPDRLILLAARAQNPYAGDPIPNPGGRDGTCFV